MSSMDRYEVLTKIGEGKETSNDGPYNNVTERHVRSCA